MLSNFLSITTSKTLIEIKKTELQKMTETYVIYLKVIQPKSL
jgi:hypothetical protein